MKPRLGSVSFLSALVGAGALMGCSSSSGGPAAPTDSGTGGNADGGPGTGPDVSGTGMACTPNTHETVGSLISLTVEWPGTSANAGCNAQSDGGGCQGTINIWLLANYDINGTTVTGTTATCGNQTPPIPLTALGTQSEGLDPTKGAAVVQIDFNPTVWSSIMSNSMKAPTQTTGAIGGWNVGSSFRINPTNSVYGLSASSPLNMASTPWPDSVSPTSLPMSDITDDDNDGHPGITATPSTANGFVLPATAALQTPPVFADELYLVLRTELQLYGTSSTCTDFAGTVGVGVLNNHVIGCHVLDGGDCTTEYTTNMASGGQAGFIDSNSTIYYGPGATVPLSGLQPSFAPPGISGTFKAKVLSTDPTASVTCADVLAAFSPDGGTVAEDAGSGPTEAGGGSEAGSEAGPADGGGE